jgi:hypothetical protein
MAVYRIYRTCRFCHKYVGTRDLVYYRLRCYAHPQCLFDAKGVEGLRALPYWMLREQVPYRLLKLAGLIDTTGEVR